MFHVVSGYGWAFVAGGGPAEVGDRHTSSESHTECSQHSVRTEDTEPFLFEQGGRQAL